MKPSADELHAYLVWANVADVAVVVGCVALLAWCVVIAVLLLREAQAAYGGRRDRGPARRATYRDVDLGLLAPDEA